MEYFLLLNLTKSHYSNAQSKMLEIIRTQINFILLIHIVVKQKHRHLLDVLNPINDGIR